jgi:Transposase DDE domain
VPESVWEQDERTRDRHTRRRVCVFAAPAEAPFCTWAGLRSLVQVERSGRRGPRPYQETAFYISSHTAPAEEFARIVRGHWQVENGLHWVKDVVLREDACTTRTGSAPENLGLLRSLAVTLFRLHGHASITRALRRFAHDLPSLFRFLE